MRLILLLLSVFCMSGCMTTTRTMQETTQLDVVADTPVGPINIKGNIKRNQNEHSEVSVNLPPAVQTVLSSGTSLLSGGAGIGGLLYALYATRQKRLKLEQAKKEKESASSELADKRDYYLRELCKGINKYLNKAPEDEAATLRACLKESLSKDTRDAIRDFI